MQAAEKEESGAELFHIESDIETLCSRESLQFFTFLHRQQKIEILMKISAAVPIDDNKFRRISSSSEHPRPFIMRLLSSTLLEDCILCPIETYSTFIPSQAL